MRRPRSGTESSNPALEAVERAAAAALAFFLAVTAALSVLSFRLTLAGIESGSGSGCLRGRPLLRAYVCGVAPGVEAGVDAVDEGAVEMTRAGDGSAELVFI